jgi:hypothetical protein
MADLRLDPAELKPLVQEIVTQVLAELKQGLPLLNGRLALNEAEAAELLGLHPWQLRDLRLAGKIGYSRIVGGRVRYTPDDLLAYLRHGHEPGNGRK